MKKNIIICCVILLLLSSSFVGVSKQIEKEIKTTISPIDETVDWWPMFHHDLNHSGYTTSTGPETNNVLWSYQTEDRIYRSSPAIVDNKVYFGDCTKNFYCLDSDTGEEIWKTPIPYGISVSSPAVENDKVYFGAGNNNAGIYCLNTTNGEIIWRYQTPGSNIVSASPAIYEGKVFIGAHNPDPGAMYCLDAETGKKIWIYQNIDSPYSAAVYNGRIYFGEYIPNGDSNIYCLDSDNGTLIWKTEGDERITIYDGKLYTGGGDLCCLDIQDGDLIWKYPTDDGIPTTPCTADGKVFFATTDGYVYCLNATSGKKIWDFDTNSWQPLSSPAYADGKIYIGLRYADVDIYCLDAVSGGKIWDFRTTSSVSSSPAVADGKLYVSIGDGELLCFGGESNNNPPHTPEEILGPKHAKVGDECTYNTSTYDPDGDQLYYKWSWDEGGSDWIGPFNSNETVEIKITFYYEFTHIVRVIAKDSNHARSDWAELEVRAPRNKATINSLLLRFLEQFPLLERFLFLIK